MSAIALESAPGTASAADHALVPGSPDSAPAGASPSLCGRSCQVRWQLSAPRFRRLRLHVDDAVQHRQLATFERHPARQQLIQHHAARILVARGADGVQIALRLLRRHVARRAHQRAVISQRCGVLLPQRQAEVRQMDVVLRGVGQRLSEFTGEPRGTLEGGSLLGDLIAQRPACSNLETRLVQASKPK